MKPLKRPMFRSGGPIKEGIMDGMKEPQAINTVGSPFAPRDASGRQKYAVQFLPMLFAGLRAGSMLRPVAQGAGIFSRLNPTRLFTSGRFRDTTKQIIDPAKIGQGVRTTTPDGKVVIDTAKKTVPDRLGLFEALKDPKRLGMAIRENPFTAASLLTVPNLAATAAIKAGPSVFEGAKEAGKLYIDALLPGKQFRDDEDKIKTDKDAPALKRVDKIVKDQSVGDVKTTKKELTGDEKLKIQEDRIEENRKKYYKLMGIDKANKKAVYDSLIDASNQIREGGNIKDQLKSGSLASSVINALSKNLDKSVDLKRQIDAAILKGEIDKDINKTKLSSFQEQIKFIRENPDDPLAKKLSGATSVADIVSASVASGKGATLTSDNIASIIESKGTSTDGVIPDDEYQKWEKNNKKKDEIDFFIEKYSGADDGLYIINKKAFRKEGNQIAPISLDSIIG